MKIYLVGGAVRDLIQGIQPKDRDFVVIGSSVEEMLNLGFEQVGKEFPVFLHPETKEEYALARKEKKTGLGYHGFKFEINNVSLYDDLLRRDLTINSMAMDTETNEIIDYFGGKNDLSNKILKHTSNAFSEDPLRVLRIARFSCQGFSIHEDTLKLISIIPQEDILKLSSERIEKELRKALENQLPNNFFKSLNEMGVLNLFFPECSQSHLPSIKNQNEYSLAEQKTILFYESDIESLFKRKILRNEEYDLSSFLKNNIDIVKNLSQQDTESIKNLFFKTKLKEDIFFHKIERILRYFNIELSLLLSIKNNLSKIKMTEQEAQSNPKEKIIQIINERRIHAIESALKV